MDEWASIIRGTLKLRPHEDIVIPRSKVKHPLHVGFKRSIGEPKGQIADYRLRLIDGRSIHVREYKDCYKVHWDIVDPSVNPIEHLRYDAPHWYSMILYTAGVVGGALTARVLRGNPMLGGLFGITLLLLTDVINGNSKHRKISTINLP